MYDPGEDRLALSNWGLKLLWQVLHPLTVFGTPAFLLVLIVYFLLEAFSRGLAPGVRSLSGVLLPLIVSTFIFVYQKELLAKLSNVNVVVSFVFSLIWGIFTMVIIKIFSSMQSPAPVNEIVVSSSFSVLVFSYVSIPQNKVLAYYYGTVSGFLIYMIFFGLPL